MEPDVVGERNAHERSLRGVERALVGAFVGGALVALVQALRAPAYSRALFCERRQEPRPVVLRILEHAEERRQAL